MERYLDDLETEAFYLDYYHFYGTPNQVGIGGYRRAPRIIRNTIRAIAPGGLYFVVQAKNKKGRYPKARHAGGHVYHYGHVRKIDKMNEKIKQVSAFWNGNVPKLMSSYGAIDTAELRPFTGSHPSAIQKWLETDAEQSFQQDPEYRLSRRDRKNRIKFWLEDRLGIEISKKHYKALD